MLLEWPLFECGCKAVTGRCSGVDTLVGVAALALARRKKKSMVTFVIFCFCGDRGWLLDMFSNFGLAAYFRLFWLTLPRELWLPLPKRLYPAMLGVWTIGAAKRKWHCVNAIVHKIRLEGPDRRHTVRLARQLCGSRLVCTKQVVNAASKLSTVWSISWPARRQMGNKM